ncbi:MAG: Flp pilus assembly protein CpaB [Phycisphaerae bacterium]|nr:Flp pilus assembly protein CpaB [Phycisphaerae bacterium]
MRSRAIIPLAVGLAVGVLAIKLFTDVLKKAKGATNNDTVQVVCANTDINPTMEIKDSMVEMTTVPRSLAPKLVFTRKDEVIGRVAGMTIPRGMAVIPTLLAPKGTPPGMATRIREGYRAVAVKVDEFAGVAGWIRPGSRVDVVAVMQTENQGARRGTVSKVILDNIEVLAVGQDLGTTGEVSAAITKSVTLLIRPEDVPRLHLAATKGTIKLAMRNQRDADTGNGMETTDKDLLSTPSTAPAEAEAPDAPERPSLLSRLLSRQPKMNADKTDKATDVLQVQVAPPQQTQPTSEPWRVEVMSGAQREEVWFSSPETGARRLENKPNDRGRHGQVGIPPQGVPRQPVLEAAGVDQDSAHRETQGSQEPTE